VNKVSANCWAFLDRLCRLWMIIANKRKTGDPCVYVPERIINRPDPCIYSQFLLMQLHQPVTWDNPDVSISLKGVEQYTYDLTVNTEYDIAITVHNSSVEKKASGTKVSVRWVEFGAGGQIRHHIDDLVANVPVWPGVDIVHTTWRTPATPGHYCIEVELTHPQDGNPANNLGWNNTLVNAAASQVQTPIRVFNRWLDGPPQRQGIRSSRGATPWNSAESSRGAVPWNLVEISYDSYVFHDAYGEEADPDRMFAPRPPAWPTHVEPSLFHFSPGETYRDVMLIVDAPNGPGPAEQFNVTVRQGGFPQGGVTVTVTREKE
jgi:hypothetical protein